MKTIRQPITPPLRQKGASGYTRSASDLVASAITAYLAHSGLVSFDKLSEGYIHPYPVSSNLVGQSMVIDNMNVPNLAAYSWSWHDFCDDKHMR